MGRINKGDLGSNKGLIIGAVIVVLAVAGYFVYKSATAPKPDLTGIDLTKYNVNVFTCNTYKGKYNFQMVYAKGISLRSSGNCDITFAYKTASMKFNTFTKEPDTKYEKLTGGYYSVPSEIGGYQITRNAMTINKLGENPHTTYGMRMTTDFCKDLVKNSALTSVCMDTSSVYPEVPSAYKLIIEDKTDTKEYKDLVAKFDEITAMSSVTSAK
jgi:hypothetical protein